MGEAFFVKYRNLRVFSVSAFVSVDWKWEKKYIQPISNALNRKMIEINKKKIAFENLQLATIHFDGSIEPRILRGKNKFKGKLFLAHAGDVVYSKIDVRNGAIGIIPPDMSEVAVSSEYPIYSVRSEIADAGYIHLVFRTSAFQRILNSMISGASGRKRVQPSQIENIEIPFPPLKIQYAIVARWREAQRSVEASNRAFTNVVNNLNGKLYSLYRENTSYDVLKSSFLTLSWSDIQQWDVKSSRAAAFRNANANFHPLGEFVEEVTEFVRSWEEPEKEWAVYGVNNKGGVFFNQYKKGKEFRGGYAYKRIRKDWFFHNPTRSSVGSLGIVPEVPENAITSPEYQVWRIKSGFIPGFVATLINTPFFVELIQFHRVGAVKQRLYVDNLLEIRIPVLPEVEQRRIAEAREKALNDIEVAKKHMQHVSREIEALILGTERL